MIVITQIGQTLVLTVEPTTEVLNIEVNETLHPTYITASTNPPVVVGPQGPPGIDGAQGPQGIQGPQGPQGDVSSIGWQQVLSVSRNTGGTNPLINNADAIDLENGSKIKKGTYDFGGNGGVSLICSVDFENNWQAGINYIFDNNGFIREASHCFNIIPDATFDNTKRFKVDSRWILDNGTVYKCTNVGTGVAVWEEISSSGNLQSVTDGTGNNITSNEIISSSNGAINGTSLTPNGFFVNTETDSTVAHNIKGSGDTVNGVDTESIFRGNSQGGLISQSVFVFDSQNTGGFVGLIKVHDTTVTGFNTTDDFVYSDVGGFICNNFLDYDLAVLNNSPVWHEITGVARNKSNSDWKVSADIFAYATAINIITSTNGVPDDMAFEYGGTFTITEYRRI